MDEKASDQSAFNMRSIQRVLDILVELSEGEKTQTEVARTVGLSKATALRLLAGLAYRSFVVRDPNTGKYSLGSGAVMFIEKAKQSGAKNYTAVRRHLQYLADVTGETLALYMRVETSRVCILEAESRQQINFRSGAGSVESAHAGAAGRLLLAALPDVELEELVAAMQLKPITNLTITDRSELIRSLAEIRQQGYALSYGERVPQCVCASVLVRGVLGVPLMSLSLLGPSFRVSRDRLLQFLPLLQHAARQMEQGLPPPFFDDGRPGQ